MISIELYVPLSLQKSLNSGLLEHGGYRVRFAFGWFIVPAPFIGRSGLFGNQAVRDCLQLNLQATSPNYEGGGAIRALMERRQ